MTKMNPVVHFEMPYKDPKRVSKFYEKVFGWKTQYLPKMGKYVMAHTSPMTKDNMHKKRGAINGGFYPKNNNYGSTHFVLEVPDLEKQMQIVKKEGGKIQGKVQNIPGVGKFLMIKDTEGNLVGLLQPVKM